MFPKGMGNMMKQAQQMQKKMQELQDQLEDLDVEGVSGGGMVKVVVSGKKDVKLSIANGELVSLITTFQKNCCSPLLYKKRWEIRS